MLERISLQDKQEKLEQQFGQKVDRLKRPINLGDYVTYCKGGGKSSAVMGIGIVVKWSSQQVQISPVDFSSLKPYDINSTRSVAMEKLLVVTEQMAANKQNYPELFI